jgi:hypothetical protein
MRSPVFGVLLTVASIFARWGMTLVSDMMWLSYAIKSYINIIRFIELNIKIMEGNLEIVNRFIGIIAGGDRGNERLQTEWEYLYKLLRSEPVAFDRIDAYLNILRQQDNSKKKVSTRTKNSQHNHPEARKYVAIVDSLFLLMGDNDDKIQMLRKSELGLS